VVEYTFQTFLAIGSVVFSLVLLAALQYLFYYFRSSSFIGPIRILGTGVFLLAGSTTLAFLGAVGLTEASSSRSASEVLNLLSLGVAAFSISKFKDSFIRADWLREQWLRELQERLTRERQRQANARR
jgi:hypothetical protein